MTVLTRNRVFCKHAVPVLLLHCRDAIENNPSLANEKEISLLFVAAIPFTTRVHLEQYVLPISQHLIQAMRIASDDAEDDEPIFNMIVASSSNTATFPLISQHLLLPILNDYSWPELLLKKDELHDHNFDALMTNVISSNKTLLAKEWDNIMIYSSSTPLQYYLTLHLNNANYGPCSIFTRTPIFYTCCALITIPMTCSVNSMLEQFSENHFAKWESPLVSLPLHAKVYCTWMSILCNRLHDPSFIIAEQDLQLMVHHFCNMPLHMDPLVDMLFLNTIQYVKRHVHAAIAHVLNNDARSKCMQICKLCSFFYDALPLALSDVTIVCAKEHIHM